MDWTRGAPMPPFSSLPPARCKLVSDSRARSQEGHLEVGTSDGPSFGGSETCLEGPCAGPRDLNTSRNDSGRVVAR